jgi:uncharacterized membrane protein
MKKMGTRKNENRNKKRQTQTPEQGQTLVELALTMVFLMILFSVVVDLGRIYFTFVALRDASQEGAAYAAIDPANTSAIETRVRDTSTTPIDLTNTANVSVTVTTTGSGCVGDTITVGVTYNNYPLIAPFTGVFFGSQTVSMIASEVNTILRSPC